MCPERWPEARQDVSAPVAGIGVADSASCPRKAARLRAEEVGQTLGRWKVLGANPPAASSANAAYSTTSVATGILGAPPTGEGAGQKGDIGFTECFKPRVADAGSCPRKRSEGHHSDRSKPRPSLPATTAW
jgi:hypothetical protein